MLNDSPAPDAEKSYSFNEDHDPRKPAQYWFQDTVDGTVLFIVFYTEACRWSRCIGCNLPSRMSKRHVPFDAIMAQVDHIFDLAEVLERRKELTKVIVSNNGSVLDERTFSSTALIYLVAKLNLHLPHMSVLTFETRPEFIDIEELEFLARALKEGARPTTLEIAIGFEAFDEKIRNETFNKGLGVKVFERMVIRLAKYRFTLKCYFMLKPVPGINDEEAILDIHRAIDYLSDISVRHDVRINMHLNPTYVARGTELERAFIRGEYKPPRLTDLSRAAYYGRDKNISIFLGLSDEGLACEGGSFIRPGDEELITILETFNRTSDFTLFQEVLSE